ncbi:hypothetical protein MgSA37_01285 [Mucilaginibacter gotjawali]|uniref:Uncharacterized protein n=1 Tax=Mucilaginibacter gotjawali TaxID=1550579 RepID=A0A110B1U3_9SPHI|nr:hypothetical protein MgSA37_01285 [Mucilaginibacter gotjawali]
MVKKIKSSAALIPAIDNEPWLNANNFLYAHPILLASIGHQLPSMDHGLWTIDFSPYSKYKLNIMVCSDSLLMGVENGSLPGASTLPNELDIFISGDSLKNSK